MKIKLPNGDIKQVGSEASTWEQRTLEKLLLEVYKQQQRANLWKWLWRGVWVLLFLSLIAAMMGGNKDMGALGKAHTAVIDINGTIDGTNDTATKVIDGMEAAYKVKNVKGIILRANSPGGSPVISKVAFDEIRRLKAAHKNIPVVVVMEDVCASGCYYIA
ncbi:MAG: S49 family peptidase, partial [Vitreoscilla sp.]|nr:S49 family peptidase [Vitreoscilla sp.]